MEEELMRCVAVSSGMIQGFFMLRRFEYGEHVNPASVAKDGGMSALRIISKWCTYMLLLQNERQ